MRTGIKLTILLVGFLFLAAISPAHASQHQRKAKKQEPPKPLPSGPTGPVPQLPLDSTPAVAPQVSYREGQLTILAPNSNLGDILRAVRKQTGAEMDIPSNANERVVTQLGPGPAREVIAELLNGSRFNYVLLGSPENASALTRVVLVPKTGAGVPGQNPQAQEPNQAEVAPMPQQSEPSNAQPDNTEMDAADDNASDDNNNADQNAAEAEQPTPNPDQPGVKTPQQMLQEMQQRQLQLQQQQPAGQPIPGAGYPPQPPPRPQQQQ